MTRAGSLTALLARSPYLARRLPAPRSRCCCGPTLFDNPAGLEHMIKRSPRRVRDEESDTANARRIAG